MSRKASRKTANGAVNAQPQRARRRPTMSRRGRPGRGRPAEERDGRGGATTADSVIGVPSSESWRQPSLADRVALLLGVGGHGVLVGLQRLLRGRLALVGGVDRHGQLVVREVLEGAELEALVVRRRGEEHVLVDLLAAEEVVLLVLEVVGLEDG